MRQIVYGSICGMIFVFILMMFAMQEGKSVRRQEVEQTLNQAVVSCMQGASVKSRMPLEEKALFRAELIQNILYHLTTDADVEIKICKSDAKKGIVSVQLDEKFLQPGAKAGRVSAQTTAILDRHKKQEEAFCHILFYVKDQLYKEYVIRGGNEHPVPKIPVVEGEEFLGWQEKGTSILVTDLKKEVVREREWEAVFR